MRRGRALPSGSRAAAALLLAAITMLASAASAEPAQHLRADEPEAWAMFYFTSVTMFSGTGTPRERPAGSVDLALDLGNVPWLSSAQRTVGFGGTKTEDLNNAPLFGRPVLTVGLPWELALSLAWVPPIKVFGLRPDLFAMALERPLLEKGPWTIGARLHGQVGHTSGPFTCPGHAAKQDPGSDGNPYGCDRKSNDTAMQGYVGLELSGSWRIDALSGLSPYLTLGANYLDNEFRVHAEEFGQPDRTRLAADTWTFSLGAGAVLPIGDNAHASLGVFYTPLWVTRPPSTHEERDSMVNVRAEISYRVW